MSHHLSETQFARCVAGTAEKKEQQHLLECANCRAELDLFGSAISSFRIAVRDRVESHIAGEFAPDVSRSHLFARASLPGWILVAAAMMLFAVGLLPLFSSTRPQPRVIPNESTTDPNALMNAVNLHLLRRVPAPMEPMFVLIPTTDATTQSGGTR